MQEFHDAGILRVVQPGAFGGFEADFLCQIDLTGKITLLCAASAGVRDGNHQSPARHSTVLV